MRELMVYPNGGIIGLMALTEGTEHQSNWYMINYFHDLVYKQKIINVGQLFKLMKAELKNKFSEFEFYCNGFSLFADPTMDLPVILPGVKLNLKVFLQGVYR